MGKAYVPENTALTREMYLDLSAEAHQDASSLSEVERAKAYYAEQLAAEREKGSKTASQTEDGNDLAAGWKNYANCLGVDTDLFYPERGASTEEAKAVCQSCVVHEECGTYALNNGEKFGIWGSMSERERRRIRQGRALASVSIKASGE